MLYMQVALEVQKYMYRKQFLYKIVKIGKNTRRRDFDMKEIDKSNEKKKYKKKNEFKFNIIFNNNGEALESIIERAFGNYCLKR